MTKTLLRAGALSCALLSTTCLTAPAEAQFGPVQPPHRVIDANGVDLANGGFFLDFPEGSIGSGQAELALRRRANGLSQWEGIFLTRSMSGSSATIWVNLGTGVEMFTGTISSLTSSQAHGGTLVQSGSGYLYTGHDGVSIQFSDPTNHIWHGETNLCHFDQAQSTCQLPPDTITSPGGKTVTYSWELGPHCTTEFYDVDGLWSLDCQYFWRLTSVTNSYGYSLGFSYAGSSAGSTYGASPPADWTQRTEADFINTAVSWTPQASVTYAYPSSGIVNMTDMSGDVWRFTSATSGTYAGMLTGIRRPGASSDTTTISYGSPLTVTREGVATSYSFSTSSSTLTTTVTDAASHVTTVVANTSIGQVTSVTDPLSRQTQYTYDTDGRRTRVTFPEGNYVNYTYDSRGNVTEVRRVAKSGSGLSDIVTSATYPSTCSDPSCNEPTTTTDERGHVTDYTYDSTHGGVLSVTGPAPSGSGTRPQTRYSYTLTNGEYRLTGISTCASGDASSGCIGTANEAVTAIAYDTNGNVTSVTRDNGAGTLTSTTAATYDAVGNLLTLDGPLSGSTDTVRFRYNAGRLRVGVVGPDPDGGGSLHNRAQRTTYTNGLPTRVETGTVNSQSDTDWASFSTLEQVDTTYDANARPTRRTLSGSSTTYAVTDMSYDSLGRPDCATVRMNPSAWGTATTACTLQTAGSYGDDRITRRTYDNAGQVTLVQTGYGVSGLQADEAATTYRSNGQVETVTDAMGNRTTYTYDGHDRLSQTRYPSSAQGAGTSNTSDYEQLSYDAASNVTSRRLRDGNSIGYSYDYLNRLSAKDLPGSELDVTYGYDLMNHLTSAATSAQTLSFTFDALGRHLTQVGPQGTLSYAYDLAGRRTQLTYADSGLYVNYDYDTAGDLTAIRENGATSGVGVLGSYAYDDRGRRTSLTRGNGTATSYTYDNVDRLTQAVHDLASTTYDITLGDSYDPAGGIVSHTQSNDIYAWGGHYAVNRSYTANGLNQYTATGSITPTYDNRGNLTSAGSITYGYSSENMLTSASGSVSLSYDPVGRLYQTSGTSTTRFGYDGLNMIAEYNSSNALQRRYVFGPGADEPLVWYEGTGTSTRRWYHADERGSIVATSDSSGVMSAINTYDEHGIPGASNSGRFQYTGQAWLPEIGMYYYRARIYSPTLGRFLQTDPTGFGDGTNLYAYVHGDPINLRDPTGTDCLRIAMSWYSPDMQVRYGDAGVDEYCQSDRELSGVDSSGQAPTSGPEGTDGGPPILVTGQRIRPIDRCAAKETGLLRGTMPQIIVYSDVLFNVAQAKFTQHSWPLRPGGGIQSVFGGSITNGESLAMAAGELISTHDFVPAGGVNFRITGNMGFVTGRDAFSPLPTTTYLTVILGPPRGVNDEGQVIMDPVSMFPGC